eukprot:6194715-Pleurochrysis_carterae.AAC.3
MAWIGLAVAASVMVGTHIGAGRLADARRAAVAVVLVGAVLSCATGTRANGHSTNRCTALYGSFLE